jgi:hypothetical protein
MICRSQFEFLNAEQHPNSARVQLYRAKRSHDRVSSKFTAIQRIKYWEKSMPILPNSTCGPLSLASVGHAIFATALLVCAQPARAYQVTQQMNQAEARDASGRVTVEASVIHVVACNGAGENGGQFYVYQYVNRPGFLAIKPPEWSRHIGGRQYATFQEAAGVACAAAAPPPPPARAASICPGLPGNPLQMTRYLHMNAEGGAINYYYHPQHDIYCGYGAISSSDFTGRYLRQEGNGFVVYIMSDGQLVRSTYYNRERTETRAGVVWDSGSYVGAENPARTGGWQSRWM